MTPSKTPVLLALALAMATTAAIAQTRRADPRAAAASAPTRAADTAQPTSVYRSAFEGYRRYADEPLLPWRQANDTVGRIGGWQA